MSLNKLPNYKEMINFEISEIDKLLSDYALLFEIADTKDFDIVETAAAATVLHSFYNGIEKIFIIINKHIDKTSLKSEKWHIELLNNMKIDNSMRKAIISKTLYNNLLQYLSFRHYFRHAYSFHFELKKLKPLFINMKNTWETAKEEFYSFMEN